MTIRRWGRNLQDAVRPFNAADELEDAPVPEPSAPPEGIAWPPGPTVREAAEADAVRAAEKAADDVHRYIDGSGVSMDAALGAYATLALAASVDALRVAITDRLDVIAEQLSQFED